MINGLTLTTTPTISVTGGTTQTFQLSGVDIPGGVEVVDVSVSDYRIRPKCQFKSRLPVQNADGSYGKMKMSVTYVVPFVDSKGVTQFNLVRVEREMHPETTAAAADDLLKKAAQLPIDSDLTAFWSTGSKA